MEQMTIWVQVAMVAMPTLWLVLGALENVRAPKANGDMVAGVLAMAQMREEFPELFAVLGRNRITHAGLHKAIFAGIVTAECLVAVLMVIGTLMLLAAAFGLGSLETARVVATLGVLGFTLIWSAFLVGGQWVHYWAGYEGAQHTHLKLTIWGGVVLCLLVL
ncbi:DUF2165 family protein [Devosia sp.]|uniref:DUF2165 family protein n=1 Tax=Devosia sp. TaxID=1871048 RepID=UPI003265A8F7